MNRRAVRIVVVDIFGLVDALIVVFVSVVVVVVFVVFIVVVHDLGGFVIDEVVGSIVDDRGRGRSIVEASFEAKAKAAVAEASASGGVGLGDRTTIIDYGSWRPVSHPFFF